jgi:hypothetical protein
MKGIAVFISAAAVAITLALGVATGTANGHATCEGLGGIEVHGQHIVGDYVTGVGGIGGGISWPPAGQVGQEVGDNGGAAVPGGPGPAFHFPNGFAPGASFCNPQAHPGGFDIPGPHGE